jgi:glycosyltransferase involved in cell wall biosynthesis
VGTGDQRVDVAVVCYFNPADTLGGSERIAWAEAELLSRLGRVVFISASPTAAHAAFPQLRMGGWTRRLYQPPGSRRNPFKLVALHLLNLFNPLVFVESLRVFRRVRPRVVHTHNLVALSPAIWFAARLSGAKVLHTHHDLWLHCERATMTDAEGRPCNESQLTCYACRALRPAKKLMLRRVSGEIFPSSWLRGRLGRQGTIVPSFSTSGLPVEAPVSTGLPVVAYIGALTPHKLGPLLDAFAKASESELRMLLVIAGTGPLEERVVAAADSSSDIRYVGQVDVAVRNQVLQQATALVIPSTCAENSPLVFFEALAAGVPVIASDIGGITELAKWGNMVLVPAGDPDALAGAFTALLGDEDRLDELTANALRHRAEASPERFAREMEGVIAALDE